ncbi:TetR/AcrR family transcriptional regulator [Sulfitobacter sp. F26204]|uniref:TetR/AcrR family transcriptional regulator n=1 Tax=Sulfitobacter sp. F26204 TaxID=2996014 RepID=UPI00225DD041|nr:TetR/AcrR family transcriptional regulator [Sulfitobacter sp. F26204]MCX7560933.1 TetR/AcrR family transcriptional regulator [Sulfitobacter sp. F26204]
MQIAILVAAEVEFAEAGFEGAGMKAIAKRAQVSQALLHYHFGNKEHLYGEVIRHRSQRINHARVTLLNRVEFDAGDSAAQMQILDALFRPALGPEGGGKSYARIFAGLIAGRVRDQDLVRECYDPTARMFLDAFERTGLDRATAGMIYQFALGVLASVISRDGRMERLIGITRQTGTAALTAALVCFVIGGTKALAENNKSNSNWEEM